MQIVDQDTHRVLAYIDALNRHGVRPDQSMVNEFAANHGQRYRVTGGMSSYSETLRETIALTLGGKRIPAESFCQYLARLSWIDDEPTGAVQLTPVGRALLKSLNTPVMQESAADVFEVVLNPDNPFAYAQALGGLSSVKQALLVEPYFRLDQLMDIAEFDNIVRVMVGSNLKTRDYDLLATGLSALPDGRSIEIRKATNLHDRYLIPAIDGNVVMLGASLGGIGKRVSTMTTLGSVASVALRDAHEKIWFDGEIIVPKKRALPVESVKAGASKPLTRKAAPAAEATDARKPSKQPRSTSPTTAMPAST